MDNSICFWLIVGTLFALAILKTHAEHRAYATAKDAYRVALASLADDPANTALRQDALRKGEPSPLPVGGSTPAPRHRV